MSYVIAYNRLWCKDLPTRLNKKTGEDFIGIDNKEDLNHYCLKSIGPETIFFPHWSTIIPTEIHENYNCIIFHMTDLPYGRGGSPLQNLIVREHKETVISAIRCVAEVDAGPVYLKKPLSLLGSAEEIFMRASEVIEDMIIEILKHDIQPEPQKGKAEAFTRRKPEDGDWSGAKSLDEVYDYIRMLDAKGYPPAFVRIGDYKLEFFRASRKVGAVFADVKIIREMKNE
ncbi:hypothetical protein JYT44_00680 [Caldithrix abyssi]|nr:hypothetical protein [Caldithrix abyssi]